MSGDLVTSNHRRKAEEKLGGPARQLAEEEAECEKHEPGFYRKGSNVMEACKKCGEFLSGPIAHNKLPDDFDTFERNQALREHNSEVAKLKSFWEGRIEEEAEKIAKDGIHEEAKELTPSKGAPAAEWKRAFEDVESQDAWRMIRESYYKSDAWAARRQAKQDASDEPLACEAQLPGCSGDYDHMHHKSYENIGCEPLWDIVPVCHHCHNVLHDKKELETEPEKEPAEVSYEDFFGEPAANGEDSTELPF